MITAHMWCGLTPTTEAPLPVEAVEEEVLGGNICGTIWMRHAPGYATVMEKAMEKEGYKDVGGRRSSRAADMTTTGGGDTNENNDNGIYMGTADGGKRKRGAGGIGKDIVDPF